MQAKAIPCWLTATAPLENGMPSIPIPPLIDTHVHLDLPALAQRLPAVLRNNFV